MIPSKKGKEKERSIEVGGEGDGKAKELIIRHEIISQKKAGSVWSWHQQFVIEWSETLITRKR